MKTLDRVSRKDGLSDEDKAASIDVSVFQRYNALYEKGTCCLVGYADVGHRTAGTMDIYPVKLRNRAVPERPINVYACYAYSIIGGDGDEDSLKATDADYGVNHADTPTIMSGVELNPVDSEDDNYDMGDLDYFD